MLIRTLEVQQHYLKNTWGIKAVLALKTGLMHRQNLVDS